MSSAEYMRKYRANPEFRRRENARQAIRNRERRRKHREAGGPKCFSCGHNAKTLIPRMKLENGELVPAQVPYCGVC